MVILSGYSQMIPQASLYLLLVSSSCCLFKHVKTHQLWGTLPYNGYTDLLIAGTFYRKGCT